MRMVMSLVAFALIATPASAAPAVTTAPIEDRSRLVTDTRALLSGTVNPNGSPTVYQFQYGRTRAYESETPVSRAGSGIADVPIDVAVEDLRPDTTYHFRLVAFPDPTRSGSYGIERTAGVDRTFRTYPPLRASFASRRAPVVAGRARIRLRAVGPPGTIARGRLLLRGRRGGRLGAATYRIAAGRTRTLAVPLRRAARRVLARQQVLAVRGSAGPARARIVLRSRQRESG